MRTRDLVIVIVFAALGLGGVFAYRSNLLDLPLLITLWVAEMPIGALLHIITREKKEEKPKTNEANTPSQTLKGRASVSCRNCGANYYLDAYQVTQLRITNPISDTIKCEKCGLSAAIDWGD